MKLNKLQQIKRAMQELKDDLKNAIPREENPNTKRLGNNSFVMSFSELSKNTNLSAEHYDFVFQADKIAELIDASTVDNIEERLTKVLSEGIISTRSNNRVHLHVDFVAKCRVAFGI